METQSTPIPELIRASASDVVAMLKRGDVSPMDLLDVLEQRISVIDERINALPTLCFERARNAVKTADEKTLGASPLAGLPIAIKDLTEVSGVRTTMGSVLYADHVPRESDILVEQIEQRGGVIYAKSNTPEFGTGGNTYNKVLGTTCNPWNTALSVAGSSGGAAAALATGTAWLAQGSDMGGSLRNPASFCGVVGLRPTIGRVAATPGTQAFDTLSTNGPMARNVKDLALFFDAMVGHHPLDPMSLPAPAISFSEAVAQAHLPKKIAFSMDLGITPVDSQVRQVVMEAVNKIEQAGVIVEEVSPDFSDLNEIFHVLRAFSYGASFGPMLAQHEDKLNQDVVWNTRQGLALTMEDLANAEAKRLALIIRVAQFFQQYELIICPATVVPPYSLDNRYVEQCDGKEFDNYYQWLSIAYAFTTAACPALSMPCGFTADGLPVGLQIAAANKNEVGILTAASAFEQLFDLNNGAQSLTPINVQP